MKLPFAFTVHSVIQAVARQYTTLCRASPERRALTHKMGQRAKRLSVSMMFQLLCGISPRTDASNVAEPNLEAGLNLQAMEGEADLATARRVSRVLEHDDPKWEASEIGYTVIAPMQGYAQLAERETDVDAFSSAVASSYGLADDIFVNGSVGACFDDDLPLTLDTMGSREYVGETFSDAMRNFFTFTRSTTAGTGAMVGHSDTFRITCGKKAVLGIQTLQTMHRLERSLALGAQACSVHVLDQAWAWGASAARAGDCRWA